MNTIVDFDTAKLLNVMGFHEPTYQSYRTLVVGEDDPNWWKVGELNKRMYCKFGDHNDAYFGICSAPTIAEVVMWLYEKHGIWISVWRYRDYAAACNDCYSFKHNYSGSTTFKTPTEAYSAAILYILNNLVCK